VQSAEPAVEIGEPGRNTNDPAVRFVDLLCLRDRRVDCNRAIGVE
jgi:hypothetical protein